MIEVKYVNSQNQSMSFIGDKILPSDGSFHKRKWTVNDEEIIKDAMTYNLTLTLRGSLAERKKKLNELCDLFEYDTLNETEGRLYFGEYYTNCFISTSSVQVNNTFNFRTDVILEIYARKQSWIKEKTYHLRKKIDSDITDKDRNLEYEYDYPYDYFLDTDGNANIVNDHIVGCDFEMIIFGPCSEPRIIINNEPYQVFTDLLDGEYLVIDSKKNTVIKYNIYGQKENLYDLRIKESSLFNKIPSGYVRVQWSGGFSFDIKLYIERSEPEWI